MRSASQAREMETSTLVTKARTAFHSAAAKAERVLIDFKSEFIADREDNGKRFSDLSERDSDDEFADNRTDSRWGHELKNSRWSVDSRTEKSWQERFRNFRGKKRVEDIEKPVDATMASQVFDGNVCHTCVKDVSEPKASESPSEDFSRFNYLDTVPLAPTMRQLAIAVEAGKELKSVKDLILSGNTSPLREKAGLSLTVMKSLVLREKEETSGREYNNDKKLCTMIESLLHEEEKRKKPPMTSEELNDTISLTRDIHAAPSKSFVVKLAEAIGSFKTLRKMAIFWCEIVNELRKLWSEGQHLPSIPLDEVPDLNYCLLYQQLQVINCCVSRKKRRAITLESLNSVKDGTTNIEELYICRGEVPSVPLIYARNNTGELVLRLGVDSPCEELKMLETGEPIYSPVTQEMPLLTEDVVKETEELVLRTGSVGVGCSQLLSDMQAFKAANPGCILEDFVRWHSPPDWTESEDCDMVEGTSQSGEIVSSRGRLSTRMQKQGNLWRELWETAKAVAAVKQTPLFDEELTVEGILHNLEDIPPSHLFEQLFLALLGSGLVNAERTLANDDNLSELFHKCKDYIALTCQTSRWSDKLDDLCQVYETVDMMVCNPEEILKLTKQQDGSGGMKRRFRGFVLNFSGNDKQGKAAPKDQNAPGENLIHQPFSSFFNAKPPVFLKKPPKSYARRHRAPSPNPAPESTPPFDENDWTMV